MESLYPTDTAIPIETEPLLQLDGTYASGLSTIYLKIRRQSDGFVLDWDSMTFVDPAGAVTQLLKQMVEFGTTFPGEYRYALDLSSVINAVTYDSYSVSITEVGTDEVGNVPQYGQFRVSPALDDATLSRKALFNNQALISGDTNNLKLMDDDGVTTLAQWDVEDEAGLAISLSPSAPAIRRRKL